MNTEQTNKNKFMDSINQHKALIYKVATIYTDNKEDRKDLVQDIYFQLWRSFDSFNKKSKMTTWMYRICLNTSMQFVKRNSRKGKYIDLKEHHISVQDEKQSTKSEAIQHMLQSIQSLNDLDKAIVLLYLEGRNHADIAEIIGISPTNVGTRIQRIKQKLNKLQ